MNIEDISSINGYDESIDDWFSFVNWLIDNDIIFSVLFFNEKQLNDYNFNALMNSNSHIIFHSEV